jgi:glyoxylase-like metal-dependent hydrolase (beta-lactamase superfamily II)
MIYEITAIPQTKDTDSNAFLVRSGDEFVLIDAPFQAIKEVQKLIADGGKLTAVILTHGHFDHIAGLSAIKKLSGAEVYIHAADTSKLTSTKENLADLFTDSAHFPLYYGDHKTLFDGSGVPLGGGKLEIFHTPGHTPGCICIVAEDTIFTGDFIFKRSIGHTGFPDSNPEDMKKSLQRFIKRFGNRDYTLCPGHYRSTTLYSELKENPFLNGFDEY